MDIQLTSIGTIHSPFTGQAGTPLLDIKPYVPRFDAHPDALCGWVNQAFTASGQADGRFA